MSLTQQFYLVVILPAGFLLLALLHLRAGSERPGLKLPWLLTLLAAAVWASGSLTYYSGVGIPLGVRFSWRLISNYALTLLPIFLLWTTAVLLELPLKRKRFWFGFSLFLWALALGLDPGVWPYRIPAFEIADQPVRHIDIWGVVWMISWALPGVLAWWFTRQTIRDLPGSLYRNQLSYWVTAVFIILAGSAIALPRELGWRELGELLAIGGAIVGGLVIARSQLPDYYLTTRLLWSRALAAVLLFSLTWLVLWLVIPLSIPSPEGEQALEIVFIAGALALIFLIINYLVQQLARRIFLPPTIVRDETLDQTTRRLSDSYAPTAVAQEALNLLEKQLGVTQSWFMTVHEGRWGQIILQPMLWNGDEPAGTRLPADSPLTAYLLHHNEPILQFDLERLPAMQNLSVAERELLAKWPAVLYIPWHSGGRLVGLLAAGPRPEPEIYTDLDLEFLHEMGIALAPLFMQARTVSAMQEVSRYAYGQYQTVLYDNQRLREATVLYRDFLNLLNPDLRRPYDVADQHLGRLQERIEQVGPPAFASEAETIMERARQPINQSKQATNSLIGLSTRLQKQTDFRFGPVALDEVARQTMRQLTPMAQARRVEIKFSQHSGPLMVWGDAERLGEAVGHLLHNAVKFNKIGGVVQVECYGNGQEAYLRATDNGVGIPEARLATIWDNFPDLTQMQTQVGKGVGLGLRLTRFIVQAHGGRVEASSAYGRGSSFAFYLPLRPDLPPPDYSD
jgi:signal transduction histidine kinase